MSDPVVALAPVTGSRRAGAYVEVTVRAPEIAASARPGQFVNVAQEAPGHLLRRPFSIAGTDGDLVSFVFDVIGPGTAWIASRLPGDPLDVVGPLGTGFSVPGEPATLVGGGYGAAPVVWHSRRLRAAGVPTRLVLGARTAARLFQAELDAADEIALTTDDGSAGRRGVVTDEIAEEARRIYACGPMPMLAAVSARAAQIDAACEVAVEEFMACGIGVCWTCVVPSDGEHLRSCTDGPVFDGRALAWR